MYKKDFLFSAVKELENRGKTFKVTHRILEVPKDIYLKVLAGYEEPFSEGSPVFYGRIPEVAGRCGGVVGMVRFDKNEDSIVLDAAVRYKIESAGSLPEKFNFYFGCGFCLSFVT